MEADQKDHIMCASAHVTDQQQANAIEQAGLVWGHAFTLIGAKVV